MRCLMCQTGVAVSGKTTTLISSAPLFSGVFFFQQHKTIVFYISLPLISVHKAYLYHQHVFIISVSQISTCVFL